MYEPFPRASSRPNYVIALSRTKIDRIRIVACRRRKRDSVSGDYGEGTTMYVHRVNQIVARPDESQLNGRPHFHVNYVGGRIGTPVDREVVRKPTFHEHRPDG
jgi:hypothetical protein